MEEKLLKMLPWGKVTAPMIPVFFIDWILCKFIESIYAINIANGIQSQLMINAFLIANGFIVSVYLVLSVINNKSQEEINKLCVEQKFSTSEN